MQQSAPLWWPASSTRQERMPASINAAATLCPSRALIGRPSKWKVTVAPAGADGDPRCTFVSLLPRSPCGDDKSETITHSHLYYGRRRGSHSCRKGLVLEASLQSARRLDGCSELDVLGQAFAGNAILVERPDQPIRYVAVCPV